MKSSSFSVQLQAFHHQTGSPLCISLTDTPVKLPRLGWCLKLIFERSGDAARNTSSPAAVIQSSTQALSDAQREWRENKEEALWQAERYRKEKLGWERGKVKAASFEAKMRVTEMLRRADTSLEWEEASRKAGVMMNMV